MIPFSWLAPVGLAAIIGLGASHWFAYSQGVSRESDRRDAQIAGATFAGMTAARGIEQSQAKSTVEDVRNVQAQLAAIPDSRHELDRLRKSNDALRVELSSASTAAQRGETATSAAMVLSDMLRRAEARIEYLERFTGRAVELAERYDDAVIRGRLCEKLSDNWSEQQDGAK